MNKAKLAISHLAGFLCFLFIIFTRIFYRKLFWLLGPENAKIKNVFFLACRWSFCLEVNRGYLKTLLLLFTLRSLFFLPIFALFRRKFFLAPFCYFSIRHFGSSFPTQPIRCKDIEKDWPMKKRRIGQSDTSKWAHSVRVLRVTGNSTVCL